MVRRTPAYEEQLAAALKAQGLGPEGPAGLVRLGSNLNTGRGSRPSSVPSSSYDPVGALGGLFAPALIRGDATSEDAFNRWMAANLKTPPSPNANFVPPPVVTQQAQSPDQSRRDAIASLLLERSPGGMQGPSGEIGSYQPSTPQEEAPAPEEDTSTPDNTTAAPPSAAPPSTAPPSVAPPTLGYAPPASPAPNTSQADAYNNLANTIGFDPDAMQAPAPVGFTNQQGPLGPSPTGFTPSTPAHAQTGLTNEDMDALAAAAVNNPVAFSPIGPPAPHTAPDPNLTDPYGPVDPQTAIQEQAQHALDAVLGPPAPQTSVTKGEPTAEEDAADQAAANATAIAQGYMSPEGVPNENTTAAVAAPSIGPTGLSVTAAPGVVGLTGFTGFSPSPPGVVGVQADAPAPAAPSVATSVSPSNTAVGSIASPSIGYGFASPEGPPSNVSSNLAASALATPTAVADPNNPFGDPTAVTAPAPAPAPAAPAAPTTSPQTSVSPTATLAAAIAQQGPVGVLGHPSAVTTAEQTAPDPTGLESDPGLAAQQADAAVAAAVAEGLAGAIAGEVGGYATSVGPLGGYGDSGLGAAAGIGGAAPGMGGIGSDAGASASADGEGPSGESSAGSPGISAGSDSGPSPGPEGGATSGAAPGQGGIGSDAGATGGAPGGGAPGGGGSTGDGQGGTAGQGGGEGAGGIGSW